MSSVPHNDLIHDLQPDILAPGADILAAYSLGVVGPTFAEDDTRRVAFNIISGASMACPHVSGVIGLLKTLYPHWSPAALKSVIMATGKFYAFYLSSRSNECSQIFEQFFRVQNNNARRVRWCNFSPKEAKSGVLELN